MMQHHTPASAADLTGIFSQASLPASSSTTAPPRYSSYYTTVADIFSRKHRNLAKKLFEPQAISSGSSNDNTRSRRRRRTPSPNSMPTTAAPTGTQPTAIHQRRVIGGGNSGIPSHAASARTDLSLAEITRRRSTISGHQFLHHHHRPQPVDHSHMMYEKPQATTSGGAISMTIQLAEPILFLQGFDHHDYASRTPAMLRGSLVVRIAKPTKVKAIGLTFRGRARTEWPEGIPPKKSEYYEEKELLNHTWPFFDSRFPLAEIGHCADSFQPKNACTASSNGATSIGSAVGHLVRSASPIGSTIHHGKNNEHRLSLQLVQSRSFSKGESPSKDQSVAARGYRVFQPGEYVYNFELPLECCYPETCEVDLGSVKYDLEGTVERPGAFRSNLTGKKEVTLVRVPSEANLESSEPIAISRTWEDQLHYDIVISGKSFPLGSSIPIAFKLTPLAKVRCHRIKIFITENIEYSCKNKRVHRLDSTKKLLLFEKRADAPAHSTFSGSSVRVVSGGGVGTESARDLNDVVNGSDNLLGDLSGAPNVGPTELEFNVQLPGCKVREKDKIHFDTTYDSIQIHHWIKIVMRLSKQDQTDPSKRRHFEISIDSPFHILSCKATHANTTLPAYGSPLPGGPAPGSCACPTMSRRSSGSPRDTPVLRPIDRNSNVPRPIHLLRRPSGNPPPFDADESPPLVTPPPKYETVVGEEGLAGYFARLADETDDDETENYRRTMPPLTPGGRVARSMDERRTWEPIMGGI